jgi:hypothetical protein
MISLIKKFKWFIRKHGQKSIQWEAGLETIHHTIRGLLCPSDLNRRPTYQHSEGDLLELPLWLTCLPRAYLEKVARQCQPTRIDKAQLTWVVKWIHKWSLLGENDVREHCHYSIQISLCRVCTLSWPSLKSPLLFRQRLLKVGLKPTAAYHNHLTSTGPSIRWNI